MDFNDFMKRLGFSEKSRSAVSGALKVMLEANAAEINGFREAYLSEAPVEGFGGLDKTAEQLNIPLETVCLAFLIYCAEPLKARYAEAGLPEALFYDTMRDLKYKNDECEAVKGITGTFVWSWFRYFYQLKRFALGRFQYEMVPYGGKDFTANGCTVKNGESIINIHIPFSGVSLTGDVRLASYKQAYDFYRPLLKKDTVPFICYSWLLYREDGFFPKNGNIYAFQNDFHSLSSAPAPDNSDVWRLFLTDTKDYSSLPEGSSLQRHLKKWLLDGKSFGSGVGIFFYNGKEIL